MGRPDSLQGSASLEGAALGCVRVSAPRQGEHALMVDTSNEPPSAHSLRGVGGGGIFCVWEMVVMLNGSCVIVVAMDLSVFSRCDMNDKHDFWGDGVKNE